MIDGSDLPRRFLFLRHGETSYNKLSIYQGQLDVPLNDTGRRQAAEAANLLRRRDISRIVSSDLSRALETATIVNRHLGVEIAIDPRLRERHFGSFQDKPKTKDLWAYPEGDIEPMEAFVARIMAAVSDQKATSLPLIVAHGGFLRALSAALPISLPLHHFDNAVAQEWTNAGEGWTCNVLTSAESALQQ
jgi:broad specificity phosphatase PhoE